MSFVWAVCLYLTKLRQAKRTERSVTSRVGEKRRQLTGTGRTASTFVAIGGPEGRGISRPSISNSVVRSSLCDYDEYGVPTDRTTIHLRYQVDADRHQRVEVV